MKGGQMNLQDAYLNQIRREGVPVTIYLVNGFQLKGTVRGFDSFTIILETDGRHDMIYKHAVSTISPLRTMTFNPQQQEERPEQE